MGELLIAAAHDTTDDLDWLGEIDLDPGSSWLKMGTRTLGDRPWLVADSKAPPELALRRTLIADRPADVLAEPESAAVAAAELEQLIAATGVVVEPGSSPLRRLGVSIQEDLCLLERSDQGWILAAAVLCFPSRWHLSDKLDRPLLGVHEPVPGYAERLARGVDNLIDGLGDRIVVRRNWFIHPNPDLYQPDRPDTEPVIPAEHCAHSLFLRSERQTLRLLPRSGWCVFTIRIQQCPLAELIRFDPGAFTRWLDTYAPDDTSHRGVSPEQAEQLREHLRDVHH